MNTFLLELSDFLVQHKVSFNLWNNFFIVDKFKLVIEFVVLNAPFESPALPKNASETLVSGDGYKHITIYEDEWRTKNELVKSRLIVNLGKSVTVFARNCEVRSINSHIAKEFFNENHLLGHTSACYYYALYETKSSDRNKKFSDEPIAVASFSSPRAMNRGGEVVNSFEWVRYASRRGVRVAGGMGKLLNCFIKEQSPQEIMSYADKDWSEGDVYEKLGFKLTGETPPIEFVVNPETYERISIKKLRRTSGDVDPEFIKKNSLILINRGNLKFLRRLPF